MIDSEQLESGDGLDLNFRNMASGEIDRFRREIVERTGDLRLSNLLFELAKRLLYTNWRNPGEEPRLHLFGQLKRIAKQGLDHCLVCKG
ncbi:MAG: hypothetical protein L0Y39_02685 [Methylococcaceae bacterium]|nr:hypothetical protein [Methylococcaceae bacterium]